VKLRAFNCERSVYWVALAGRPENHHLPLLPSHLNIGPARVVAPNCDARTGIWFESVVYERDLEARYQRASELANSLARLSLHHSARNTRAGVVPPVVLVGIGQLAGCNGAIRSAVPFRCFASRTSLPRLHRPDLLELCIEISSSSTISIFFTHTSSKSYYNRVFHRT